MGNQLLRQPSIFRLFFIVHHVILWRKYPVDTKQLNIIYISSGLDLGSFKQFSQGNIGIIFANLSMEHRYSFNTISLQHKSVRCIPFSYNLLRSSNIYTISDVLTASISADLGFILFFILLVKSYVLDQVLWQSVYNGACNWRPQKRYSTTFIRQLSNPFANLCQIALRRSQINALLGICPELDPNAKTIPTGNDAGNGYFLLTPRKRYASSLGGGIYWDAVHTLFPHMVGVQRWGRLNLPNGQVAWSLYSETPPPPMKGKG